MGVLSSVFAPVSSGRALNHRCVELVSASEQFPATAAGLRKAADTTVGPFIAREAMGPGLPLAGSRFGAFRLIVSSACGR